MTSDLGRPLEETFRESPSPPRNLPATLPTDRPRMPTVSTNHCINGIFGNRTEDTNHGVNTVPGSDSAIKRAAGSSSVEAQPAAGNIAAAVQQTSSLVEPPRMTDNINQQFIAGRNMANEMRAQHRQQVRNDRAGGTRTPSHTVPTAFQQMTALSQGRLMEPPVQAPVHNLDPLGFLSNSSLFAGSNMVPQQAEVSVTSTQQTDAPASRSLVVLTPVPDANRTRTPPVDEVPVIFDGSNRTCTICQEELEDGDMWSGCDADTFSMQNAGCLQWSIMEPH